MAAVAVTAAVSTAASISTTIVAEAELSPSISQQSSGFTDPPPDNTFVTICHKCGEQVVESVVDMISKLQSGRLHIHCQALHCNTIVCHSSSLFSNAVYSNAPAADTQLQFSIYSSADSLGANIHSPRNSLSDCEPPTKPPAFSAADIETHGFDKLSDRHSSSWSSTMSDYRLPTRATSPEISSMLSGRRNTTASNRTDRDRDSIISLTPSDPTRHRGWRISQSSALSDSPRNSADHNLLKLATKNRSRVSLQSLSKAQPIQSIQGGVRSTGDGSTTTSSSSIADALADTNAVSIPAAAGFAFVHHRPRPLSQPLAVPHSGNTRMPTPVPEEGGTPFALAAAAEVLPSADVDERAVSLRAAPGSAPRRQERPTRQEQHQQQPRRNQRGIRGFGCFVKRGLKKLPSRLQKGVVGLIRVQLVLRSWEGRQNDRKDRGKGMGKGKEPEVVLPEPEPEASHERSRERNSQEQEQETTVAPTHAVSAPITIPDASSSLLFSASPSASLSPAPSLPSPPSPPSSESSPPLPPLPSPSLPSPRLLSPGPGPVEEAFHDADLGQELDRQQFDVSSTQQISDTVRNAMSEAWAQPEAPVIVAMRVPVLMGMGVPRGWWGEGV